MKAVLIAVGERAPEWVADGFSEYQKRLSHWLPLQLHEIAPGVRVRAVTDAVSRRLSTLEPAPESSPTEAPPPEVSHTSA